MRLETFAILFPLLWVPLLAAVQQSGSVRAADQFIPGATVTAVQGETKITTFTNETGRYTLDLAPGVWDIQVQAFGFTPVHQQITVGTEPVFKDWTVEMPRIAGAPVPGPTAQTRNGRAGGRGGRGQYGQQAGGRGGPPAVPNQPGVPQRPGFQSAAVTATQDGQQALADAANAASAGLGETTEADDAFLVNGSTSGGLAQSSDDEARRQRMAGRGGGPPGMGPDGGGPPGMGLNST